MWYTLPFSAYDLAPDRNVVWYVFLTDSNSHIKPQLQGHEKYSFGFSNLCMLQRGWTGYWAEQFMLPADSMLLTLYCQGLVASWVRTPTGTVSPPHVIVQSPSFWRFVTSWTAAHQTSLSLTISRSLPKFMSIASVMPSSHLILWCPLLLLPSIFPSIRDFSSESAVRIRWPKYWNQNTNILHTNLQVLNFSKMQTCIPSVSGVSEIAACPPSPIADGPLALPSAHPSTLTPPLPPAVSNASCLFTWCQSLCARYCTVLLYFSGYCTVRLKMFSLFFMFFMYYLCEKYHKPIIIQNCITDCLSWIPRLILLDLTNWTYKCTLGTLIYRGLSVLCFFLVLIISLPIRFLTSEGSKGKERRRNKLPCSASYRW